ncbi:unnamed protein product, partial [Effrenium voratum]
EDEKERGFGRRPGVRRPDGKLMDGDFAIVKGEDTLEYDNLGVYQPVEKFPLADEDLLYLLENVKDTQDRIEEAFQVCGGVPEPWDVLELCCGPESLLLQEVQRAGGRGGRAGLFNDCDLMKNEGLQNVLNMIKQHRPRWLWISLPCGPSSPIQNLNEITEKGKRKGDLRQSKAMVKRALIVARYQLELGGEVAQEWPRGNYAWKWDIIEKFWSELRAQDRCHDVLVDGGQFGLMDKGWPIKKPWRIRVTDETHLKSLHRLCPGDHEHAPCLGGGGRYTPSFCRTAAKAMMQQTAAAYGSTEPQANALGGLTSQEINKLAETVLKLHRQCGHPSNRALIRALRSRGASEQMQAVAHQLNCPECQEGSMATPMTQVSLEKADTLWHTVQIDTFYMRIGTEVHHFLLYLDEASVVTDEIVTHPDYQHENVATPEMLDTMLRRVMLNEQLEKFGIGWKFFFGKPETVLSVKQLGRWSEDLNPASASHVQVPGHPLEVQLRLRREAEAQYKKQQDLAKLSRATNSRAAPVNQFLPGDLVYYKRFKTPRDRPAHDEVDVPRLRVGRWFGPGRVLAAETRVREEGIYRSASSSIWIISQGRLKKVHRNQLRHASETERLIAENTDVAGMPWTFTQLVSQLNKGEFDDLTQGSLKLGLKQRSELRGRSRSRLRMERRSSEAKIPFKPEPQEDDELIEDPESRKRQLSETPASPEDEIDIDRLLSDLNYNPLERYTPEEREKFRKKRMSHEGEEIPLHVRKNLPAASSSSPVQYVAEEEAENGIFGITIPTPANEMEWKKIVKNPAKFAAKNVQKGAE